MSPDAYPISEPEITWIYLIPLYLTLLSFPILFIDFILLLKALAESSPTPRALAGSFTISSFYLLFLIFAQIFTTVYDYIPVVGPFFRDKFWLAHFFPAAVLLLAVLGIKAKVWARIERAEMNLRWFAGIACFGLISIVGAYISLPRPMEAPLDLDTFTVLTYNIQQGYSEEGMWNFDGQLALVQRVDPDIIGLQESDTNRIAGGNKDVVGYFANKLDMHQYYGPSPVTGTFGIALLSKYPIQAPKTYFVYSVGEQVAVIEAQITINEKTYNVYVNHLGNGGPIIQQEQFLEIVSGKRNIIAIGDYNFRPKTDQYRITMEALEDAFDLSPVMRVEDEFDTEDRIDHIFVSPEIQIEKATYIISNASDHPAMFAVVLK
jgi:endonuclease/exonuclease/phosphatase family metal-dependent hydrolase